MFETKKLQQIFKECLDWHGARIIFLANFILALVKVRSVNLTEIVTAFTGKAKIESKYKRLQRFFRGFSIDYDQIARILARLQPVNGLWTLTIDRTNWKLGKANINILMMGIAYMGIAFPLLWITLDKKGNSNTAERITLMEKFISLFGTERINCVTADREFIGEDWFGYLINKKISFRIRIKDNFMVTNAQGIPVPAKDLFRFVKPGEYHVLPGPRVVLGHSLYIIGALLPDGEYLIIVTDQNPDSAIDDYKQRWEIETLFGCLKTRGFCFESTHMIAKDRIKKLVALLAIAFGWCHLCGEWRNTQTPIKIKKHGRRAISFFRYGLDCLREALFNLSERKKELENMIDIIARKLFLQNNLKELIT